MKRVLSIAWNELTNDNRVLNEAMSLQKKGYDVTVLGYRMDPKAPTDEVWNGLKIRKVNITHKHLLFNIPYVHRIYKEIHKFINFNWYARNFDYIHCHDLNTLQFGAWAKFFKRKKIKLVYDAHEYETQRNGLDEYWQKRAMRKERKLIGLADRVITVSPTIADEYVRLYGIEKPALVLNCPILRTKEVEKKNLFREKFNIPESKKIFLYQGYLYPGRGIEVLLEAWNKLNLDDAALVFMGEGNLTATIEEDINYGKTVFVHPFVPGDVLLNYTSSADLGISFIQDISLSDRYCLPNKLFEYIAAGLPVLSSGLPDLTNFINTHKVGVAAPSNDVDGFIQAFNNLPDLDSAELKSNILKTRELFHWGTQEKVLYDLYDAL